MAKYDQIIRAGYSPTLREVADCCAIRQRIFEHRIAQNGDVVDLVHISYQRNEQRKWLHVLDDVDAMLFSVSLSDYDQSNEETGDNKLVSSLIMVQHHDI